MTVTKLLQLQKPQPELLGLTLGTVSVQQQVGRPGLDWSGKAKGSACRQLSDSEPHCWHHVREEGVQHCSAGVIILGQVRTKWNSSSPSAAWYQQ